MFSERSAYADNYERVADDHVGHLLSTGENPFIAERLWKEAERITVDQVRRHSQPGQRILDVGVGTGRLLSNFPELDRHGVDISTAYLEIASRVGIDVCYALIEELPYRPDSFDVVTCTDVLEHVLDLQRSLDNILTVLRPGGKLIVRVPYREELDAYVLHEQRFDFLHVRNFDEFSLRLILEKVHGCSFVEMDLAGGRWMSRFLLVQRLCHLGSTAVNRLSPSLWSRIPMWLITPYELGMVFEH